MRTQKKRKVGFDRSGGAPLKLKIKKGSLVQVIAGNDKGRKGEVLGVLPGPQLIKVSGVRVQTHFDKQKHEIQKKEGYIHYSNVKLVSGPKSKD